MFTNIFLRAVQGIWPMLFIFTVIIVSIRFTYLIYNKQKIVLYKEILMLCFIIYILLLYYIVTFQDNNYGTNNFVPFKEIFRYKITSSLFIRNVVGNVLLFVPFGLFVTHYVKNKSFLPTMLLSLLVSCAIEFAQSSIGRTADIDDVILNTLGGLFGYLLYRSGDKVVMRLPKFLKNPLFLDVLSLVAILVMVYLAFRFDFWRIIS
ncbi:MAG: VanZ family protein [Bacilli bacterium]|nr:VanZ family protein [Bacilli bacterium]